MHTFFNRACLAVSAGLALMAASVSYAAIDEFDGKPLSMTYRPADRETTPQRYAEACAVTILPASDNRANKEAIGMNHRGALLSGDMAPWFNSGLNEISSFGYANNSSAGGLQIKAELNKAYVWQLGLKIFSMISMKVQFTNSAGMLQEKVYRAHGDKTNMWGADDEYVTTLNYGLNNILPAMAKDLQALCKGQKVDAYTYAHPDPVKQPAKRN